VQIEPGEPGQVAAEPGAAGRSPGALSALLVELARAPGVAPDVSWEAWLRPGAVVGRFELVRELGRGGFGVVWEARDPLLGRSVAFKAVRAGAELRQREERLQREAEAAARLAHPNIVTLHDLGSSVHGPYLVLELLRGQSLSQRLQAGALPVREALRVGIEVARALAHAHAHGVVHRDLNPANVFLCGDGQVKVLDFGLSLVLGGDAVAGGTPGFMAPEQWRGESGDARTDLFALGVLLTRLLAGRLPFDHDREPGVEGAPPPLQVAEAPGAGTLVARLLELEPERRPGSAGEVAAALTAILREAERSRPGAASEAVDVRAWELYLRGRRFLQQTRRASLRFAEELFGRAVVLDPGFALAHAGRAEAIALCNMYYPPEQAELEQAAAASARAVELAPAMAEAHAAHGLALTMLKRPAAARQAFERALELDPGLPEAHYYFARACYQGGQIEEAATRFRAAAGAGEHYQAAFFAAQASEALGRGEEAREAYAAALAVVERHMDLNPDDARAATMRAVSLCRLGRREEGLHWGEQASQLDPQDAGVRYNVACLLALEGQEARALDELAAVLQAGFGNRDWIRQDPDLASLRGLPRFRELMADPGEGGAPPAAPA
jgi:tetratricopeptide (TPR) repeat protein